MRKRFLKFAVICGVLSTLGGEAIAHEKQQHGASKPAQAVKEQHDWGIAGDAVKVTRTINISMSDNMRFTPDKVEVKLGETVKFVHKNEGKILHEFVLGTKKTLDEHATMMMKYPNMEHDEPYMTHVAAGKTGEIIWTFNRAGEFDFACLIPGHYQAGMVGTVMVK